MGRSVAVAMFFACTFTSPAWAEEFKVKDHQGISLPKPDDAILEAFELALNTGVHADWRESPGADILTFLFDGSEMHVKVYPGLEHPGNGNPQCCVSFIIGDTLFWLKGGGPGPAFGDRSASPESNGASAQTPATNSGLVHSPYPPDNRGDGASSTSADGSVANNPPNSDAGNVAQPPDGSVSLAQVPEPALMLMLGLGISVAARRIRERRNGY